MSQATRRKPRRIRVGIMAALAAVVGALLPAVASPSASASIPGLCQPFEDVDWTNQHCDNIAWLRTVGITKPADGLYHPAASVTRGSMTLFLFRLTHPDTPAPTCPAKPFDDVPVDSTFCGVVTWLVGHKITYGVGDRSNYGVRQPVTRQSMATFLHRISRVDHPGKIGDTVSYFHNGKHSLDVTVEQLTQVAGPIGEYDDPPVHTYLVFDIKIQTFAGISSAAYGVYSANPFNWTVKDKNGYQYDHALVTGLSHEFHSDDMGPDELLRGSIAFDAPSHGSLTLDPFNAANAVWEF